MTNTLHNFFIHFTVNKDLFNLSTQLSTENGVKSPIFRFIHHPNVNITVDKLDNLTGCPSLHNNIFAINFTAFKN